MKRMHGTVVAALTAGLTAAAALTGFAPAQAASAGHPAGTYNAPFSVTTFDDVVSYDVAAASTGTAYIGWISSTGNQNLRQVHLCTLPVDARACVGGIQTIESGDQIDARDLHVRVLPGNVVSLVWQDITADSVDHPRGDHIMQATAPQGRNLTAGVAMADAPSYGRLMGVERGSDGTVWTLDYPGLPSTELELRSNWTGTPQTLETKYQLGFAQLAVAGTKPYVTFQEVGQVSRPNHWGTATDGVWRFAAIAKTWTVDTNALLTATNHGLRMVAATNNASYRPVISAFSRGTFGPVRLTSDRSNCNPRTHDGATDRSGRLLDVSLECNQLALATYTPGLGATVLRFAADGLATGVPQVASGVRGIATLVWSTQPTTGTTPLRLWVRRVRVPGATRTAVTRGRSGSVSVTGPQSCQPPSNITVSTHSTPAAGWRTVSRSFTLGGARHSARFTLDGAALKPGTRYTLTAGTTFGKGKAHAHRTTSLTFTTCPTS